MTLDGRQTQKILLQHNYIITQISISQKLINKLFNSHFSCLKRIFYMPVRYLVICIYLHQIYFTTLDTDSSIKQWFIDFYLLLFSSLRLLQ